MKRLCAILTVMWLCSSAPAHAGPDGSMPSPGLCDYPGVGGAGLVGVGTYYYWCDFPTEVNGSHWHAEIGGVGVQAAVTAGFTISFLTLSGTLGAEVGGIVGSTSWRCPDNSLSEAPNPPGAWKNYLVPSKCKTIGAAPPPIGVPEPNTGPLAPVAILAPPSPAGSVTNPDNPNPDATVNPR